MDNSLKSRIETVRENVSAAAGRSGRIADAVTIMAVTKTLDRSAVLSAYREGIRVFGENRVREAAEKYTELPGDLELHLIGHLQTNKAKTAAETFAAVDSIDSFRTASALQNRLESSIKTMDILLELNTAGETSKSGYPDFDSLLRDMDRILTLPRLRIRGLMTIGPLTGDQERIRRSFRQLRAFRENLSGRFPGLELGTLSMGMSSDYEMAVEEGATVIRLGTALFGGRKQ